MEIVLLSQPHKLWEETMLALKESIEKCVTNSLQRLFEWSTMLDFVRETAHDYSSINHRNKFTFKVTVHSAFGPPYIALSALYSCATSLSYRKHQLNFVLCQFYLDNTNLPIFFS